MLRLLLLVSLVTSLHFYLDDQDQKCFIEELPHGTTLIGTYRSENLASGEWKEQPEHGIHILIDEIATKHNVLKQRGGSNGRFTFTSAESGDYIICFASNTSSSWFGSKKTRLFVDVVFGDVNSDHHAGKRETIDGLLNKVKDVHERLTIIKAEQEFQRDKEKEFRNMSERVNSKVVWWTLAQLSVLGVTATLQIRKLKTFFIAKKLV